MKTRRAIAILPVLALQGCASIAAPLPDKLRPPELTTCGAVELLELVGQPVKEVAPSVLENARVIRPGQAVTMDFSPTRLNLDLDTQDRIARVWCG